MHDGSFQVLLRLTQDVHGWRSQAARLRSTVVATVDVEANAIGRTTGGRPLASVGHGGFGGDNDFTFAGDPAGATTPLSAHIRRINPRDDDVFDTASTDCSGEGRRSARTWLTARRTRSKRGMIFNAFMASIGDQFEHVQRHWANPFTSSSTRTSAASVESDAR